MVAYKVVDATEKRLIGYTADDDGNGDGDDGDGDDGSDDSRAANNDVTNKHNIGLWKKRGMTVSDIADLLERDKGTISRHFKKVKKVQKPLGRPPALTDAEVARLLKVCEP